MNSVCNAGGGEILCLVAVATHTSLVSFLAISFNTHVSASLPLFLKFSGNG